MATLHLTDDHVEVRLTTAEKLAALRGDHRVPTDRITGVEVFDDGLDATRGIRAPGLAIPGRRRIGTWRRRGGKELVSVRGGQPAVRISLHGDRYLALVIGLDDPTPIAEALEP